jgi:hypothetical protein
MFYVYEIKLHSFQNLFHSNVSLFEKVSIENDWVGRYRLTCVLYDGPN